jgi:EpsI family protein
MNRRGWVLFVVILAASPLARGSDPIAVQPRLPFGEFPLQLSAWRGVEGPPVEEDVAKVLGADDYVNRVYVDPQGAAVGLWVAFYGSQRQGDAIHSPLNCLPGTGWTPVAHTRPMVQAGDSRFRVNRYVVQKRGERQLVTYWFQGRDRAIASEYVNKAYLLVDAVRRHRTDGALIRLVAPIRGNERAADAATASFITALQPALARWLPR